MSAGGYTLARPVATAGPDEARHARAMFIRTLQNNSENMISLWGALQGTVSGIDLSNFKEHDAIAYAHLVVMQTLLAVAIQQQDTNVSAYMYTMARDELAKVVPHSEEYIMNRLRDAARIEDAKYREEQLYEILNWACSDDVLSNAMQDVLQENKNGTPLAEGIQKVIVVERHDEPEYMRLMRLELGDTAVQCAEPAIRWVEGIMKRFPKVARLDADMILSDPDHPLQPSFKDLAVAKAKLGYLETRTLDSQNANISWRMNSAKGEILALQAEFQKRCMRGGRESHF